MPQAIVNKLEAIQIDVKQANRLLLSTGVGEFPFQLFGKVAAVRQTGKRIASALLKQTQLGLASYLIPTFQLRDHPIEPVGELCNLVDAFNADTSFQCSLLSDLVHHSRQFHNRLGYPSLQQSPRASRDRHRQNSQANRKQQGSMISTVQIMQVGCDFNRPYIVRRMEDGTLYLPVFPVRNPYCSNSLRTKLFTLLVLREERATLVI